MNPMILGLLKKYGMQALGVGGALYLDKRMGKQQEYDEAAFNQYADSVKKNALMQNNQFAKEGTARIANTFAGRGMYGSSGQGVAQIGMEGELNKNYQNLLANIDAKRFEMKQAALERKNQRKADMYNNVWSGLQQYYMGREKTPGVPTVPKVPRAKHPMDIW
ncbi:MAG: hypothetical protein WC616_01395 [Candidatus Omnitrophota bacterium]